MSAFSNLKIINLRCLLFYHSFRIYCIRFSHNYKNTIFLPKSNFPHRVNASNRVERDKFIENEAKFEELYNWHLKNNTGQQFVLHDGPPYANGDIHVGHAVNKVLKDITLRHKVLNGDQVHFVPGWDCHGLPIELKVVKDSKHLSKFTALELRKKAFEFAQKAKGKQLHEFKKWGLMSDWSNYYMTCHPDYIITQLQLFCTLHEKGLVYRDYKPVFWSPCNQTSLAEAELEYNEQHESISVYVKFPVVSCPDVIKSKIGISPLYVIIWTTTPWSLPANQAICYSSNYRYAIVQNEANKEMYIVASDVIPSIKNSLNVNLKIIDTFDGSALQSMLYSQPFCSKELPLLSGSHVTISKGTGLVHMAPNHGHEDYSCAQEHNISLSECLVDEQGCYTAEAGEALAGKDVLSSGMEKVIELLKHNIVFSEKYVHSYPYDWRSKRPVIIRSSYQWFIDIHSLKKQAERCLKEVQVIPCSFKRTFQSQLEKSPQWCISRQRMWGVPIPVFYTTSGKVPFTNRHIINHLCSLIKEKGIHVWWELPEEELFTQDLRSKCNLYEVNYKKGTDILDIWFDSGISWKHVLPGSQISDLCIEGLDQIRGWFYSSLLTSVAYRNVAPYRKLFLHGFTTDADGCKMSKSVGNVVNPSDIIEGNKKQKTPAFGIDVMRWWIANHACQHENIPVKQNILEECYQSIAKIRNVLKFLLGSLENFNFYEDRISFEKMRPLDQYMLFLLKGFSDNISKSYDELQYKNVSRQILNFVTNDVSSFYCHLIKDRLYCEASNSIARLSCQTVLSVTLDVLVKSIAPIVPHLAEEVFLYHPNKKIAKQGVFRQDRQLINNIPNILNFPQSILWANEIRNKILKSEVKTTNMEATIVSRNRVLCNLQILSQDSDNYNLCELFQVSDVKILENFPNCMQHDALILDGTIDTSLTGSEKENYKIVLTPSKFKMCPRCRRLTSLELSTLCPRCEAVLYAKNVS